MAYKDFRDSKSAADEAISDTDQALQQEIQKIFLELGRELGMNESDLLFPGETNEQITLVYDKFDFRRR